MPEATEKIREIDLEHEAIERYLREVVVKIYDEAVADPSRAIPLEQARAKSLAKLAALELAGKS